MNRLPTAVLLLAAVLLGLFPWANAGRAALPMQVIVVESMTLPIVQGTTKWIRAQLEELGYREEQDIRFRIINAEGDGARAQDELGQALSEDRPDLVVTVATLASRAGRELLLDSDVPQLFAIVADPVGEGFAPELGAASGSNISGRTHVLGVDTILEQASRILQRPDGQPFRIALLCSSYPSAVANHRELMSAQSHYANIEIVPITMDYQPGEGGSAAMLEQAVAAIESAEGRFDGLWIATGPSAHDSSFRSGLRARSGLPLVFGQGIEAVREGALMALSSNDETNGRAVGKMAAAVLNGAPLSDMPIERPTTFVAAVNISTAIGLGVSVPSDLIELAGPNIFR